METIDEANLLSIPGIGPVYAAGIIAEIGRLTASIMNEVGKYAGQYWQNISWKIPKRTDTNVKSGNHYAILSSSCQLCKALYSEYKDYYDKKYNEVPKAQHKRALVLTARNLCVWCLHS